VAATPIQLSPGEGQRRSNEERQRICSLSVLAVRDIRPSPQGGNRARRPVSRVLSPLARGMTIHLGRPSPNASRDRPGWRLENPPGPVAGSPRRPTCHPYLVLLPVGFTLPPPLPAPRCALTAPFHPCRPGGPEGSQELGGLLSVALSLRSPSPGVTRHRVSVEPGLSSRRPASLRSGAESGHPAVWHNPIRA
jgi:hypothetical protein